VLKGWVHMVLKRSVQLVLKRSVQLVHESKEVLLSDLTRLVVINYRFLSMITSLHSHLESLQHSRLYTNRLSI
jgi:hypothetical protein